MKRYSIREHIPGIFQPSSTAMVEDKQGTWVKYWYIAGDFNWRSVDDVGTVDDNAIYLTADREQGSFVLCLGETPIEIPELP